MIGSLVSPRLVGRDSELAVLSTAAEHAAAGTPTAVLVAGEAGVGKSRLVTEAARRLEADGWRVLSGECVELGSEGLAFAPLTDVLRMLAASCTDDELAEVLGPARQELAWLLPELGDDSAPVPAASPAQFLELVLSVMVRLARLRPLLLVVEDLHWADRSTLELVSFLVHAFRNAPVM